MIVQNEGGTGGWESWVRYHVLDGATGKPRWQRENAGLRPSRFSLFVDAFSGKDGHTLWWNRAPLGDAYPSTRYGGIGPMQAISGRTGRRLWATDRLCMPTLGQGCYVTDAVRCRKHGSGMFCW